MNAALSFWSAQRDRRILWIPVIFGVGIGAYFSLRNDPHDALFPTLTLLSGGLWLASRGFRPRRFGVFAANLCAILTIASAGASIAQFRTASVDTLSISKRTGPALIEGRIRRLETFPDGFRVVLDHTTLAGARAHGAPALVRVRFRGGAGGLSPGTWIRFRAILSPPSAPLAPGAFDFQRRAYFQGIGAIGFAIGKPDIAPVGGRRDGAVRIAELRHLITQRILTALPEGTGGVAAALITGERSAVRKSDLDSIRNSGLAHLLAISGLHVGLVAGLLFVFSRMILASAPRLALSLPIKKWAAVLAMTGAFAYAVLAGATLPTQRAFLMISLALLGVILDRRGLSLRSVAWAAMVVLTVQPESLLGASFQMSFAAVVALIASYEHLSSRRRAHADGPRGSTSKLGRFGRYLAGIGLTTIIASAATAPFAIYHFNRIADYGVMANLLAVPVTGLWVMPWAIVGLLAMPFGGETWALQPMGWGIGVILAVAHEVAGWPGAVTLVPAMPDWALVSVTLGGLWLCLWKGSGRALGAVGPLAAAAAVAFATPPDILISQDGKVLAIRDQRNALLYSSNRGGRFQRDIWTRLSGAGADGGLIPVSGSRWGGNLSCDVTGCIYRKNGYAVALVRTEHAALEDCGRVDLIIALFPLYRPCRKTPSIDRFDLWRKGAHAVSLTPPTIRIRSVAGERGHRPWVIRPTRRGTAP